MTHRCCKAAPPVVEFDAAGSVWDRLHNLAIDRQGNLYTSEVGYGRRVQKFALVSF